MKQKKVRETQCLRIMLLLISHSQPEHYAYTVRISIQRPCDASCLSVVSFSTSSAIFCYWLLRFQIYRCVNILFCSLLIIVVVHAGCDKQDSLMRRRLCGKLHGG